MSNFSSIEILENNLTTLKETSFDKDNKTYMSQSLVEVVDFDKVKESCFINGISTKGLRSNDALIINRENERYLFIEFKNGNITSKIKKEEIRTKISESLLILNHILDKDLKYDKEHISYILVYNKEKNKEFENQRFYSLSKMSNILGNYSKMSYLIKGFGRYNIFFRNVKTINEEEFQDISKQLENKTYNF